MVSLFKNDMILGFYYEIIVMGIVALILLLILRKYSQKKHRLTLLLFFIFLNYFLGIFFSWGIKFMELYQLDLYYAPIDSPFYYVITLMKYFRLTFAFITIAILISYGFKIEVFQDKYNLKHTVIVWLITLGIVIYNVSVVEIDNTLLDVYAFAMVFLFMVAVYGSFMRKTIIVNKKLTDQNMKSAFKALTWMCVFYMAVLLFFLLDRVMIMIDSNNGYTIFYFLGWTSVVLAMVTTYFGYLAPRSPKS